MIELKAVPAPWITAGVCAFFDTSTATMARPKMPPSTAMKVGPMFPIFISRRRVRRAPCCQADPPNPMEGEIMLNGDGMFCVSMLAKPEPDGVVTDGAPEPAAVDVPELPPTTP